MDISKPVTLARQGQNKLASTYPCIFMDGEKRRYCFAVSRADARQCARLAFRASIGPRNYRLISEAACLAILRSAQLYEVVHMPPSKIDEGA